MNLKVIQEEDNREIQKNLKVIQEEDNREIQKV